MWEAYHLRLAARRWGFVQTSTTITRLTIIEQLNSVISCVQTSIDSSSHQVCAESLQAPLYHRRTSANQNHRAITRADQEQTPSRPPLGMRLPKTSPRRCVLGRDKVVARYAHGCQTNHSRLRSCAWSPHTCSICSYRTGPKACLTALDIGELYRACRLGQWSRTARLQR